MTEADHPAEIAEQGPGEGHARDNEGTDDQPEKIGVRTEGQRSDDREDRQAEAHEQLGDTRISRQPRRRTAPKSPFGKTKSTTRKRTIPASS